MIHQFDHRWATYDGLESRDATPAEKSDPAFEPEPRYWVPEGEVFDRLAATGWTRGWLMSWRNITNATNERTVIASVFPVSAVGHTAPLFFTGQQVDLAASLLSVCTSLTLDFVARQKVGGMKWTPDLGPLVKV
jgi:hypothetical protein